MYTDRGGAQFTIAKFCSLKVSFVVAPKAHISQCEPHLTNLNKLQYKIPPKRANWTDFFCFHTFFVENYC